MGLITEQAMERLNFGSRLLRKYLTPFDFFPRGTGVPKYLREDFLTDMVSQLVAQRHLQNLSGISLDAKIGCAECLVAKWETGIRAPTTFNLLCWAEALDCKWVLVPNNPKKREE